jgi:hypothetical protein
MGSDQSSHSYTETDIKNVMNTMVTNATKNINNIINDTTTIVTTNVINNNVSLTKVTGGCSNIGDIGDITLGGTGNKISVTQTCIENLKMSACQQLSNDSKAMADLATKVNASVSNQLTNNNAAQDSLKTLAQCQLATQQQGGVTGVLTEVAKGMANIAPSITGANTSSDSKTITKVLTQINVDVSNLTENINNITNAIKNQITTGITNSNQTTCQLDGTGSNVLKIKSINSTGGTNNTFSITQSASIDGFVTCIQNNINTTELATSIAQSAGADTTSKTTNSNAVSNVVENTAKSSTTKTLISDFEGMFGGGSTGLMSCGICCCCILIILAIVAFVAMQMM